jgi:nucleotide-binding universal stress UspA family protein
MSIHAGAPVVVGVDGSPSSLHAVSAAVPMAAERHRPLRVVHAFIWPLLRVPLGPGPGAPDDAGLRHDAERIVADAVAHARSAGAVGLDVSGEVVTGAAAAVLLAEARDAALVVIGDRGLGGFSGLLLGSVAVQLAAHAPVPVMVVRGTEHQDGPVVVGVDGSGDSDLAIGFAFEEAAFRNADLRAVHAWTHPIASEPGDMLPLVYDVDDVTDEATRLLAEALAGWRDRYPEVKVSRILVRGRARQALVEESTRAQLLVVGARGRGGFTGLLLGSVSQTALHHASCPVAVVRHG